MDQHLFPLFPPNLARLCSRLAGRDIALPLPGFTLRPDLAGAALGGADENPGDSLHFALEADGEPWLIRAGGPAVETLLSPPEGLNFEDIPAELRPAFWALSLEPLLSRASAALGRSLRPAGPDGSAGILQGRENFTLPFILTDSEGKTQGAGRAIIPLSQSSLALLADVAKAFPRRRRDDPAALILPLSLCAGREAFPLELLRETRSGDVLLFAAPAPILTLDAGGLALWSVNLAAGKITLQGRLTQNPQEAAMNNKPETGANPPGKVGEPAQEQLQGEFFDSLEVTLSLELEERQMSVGELATLAPGQTLETSVNLDAPVTLKVGRQSIGRGRLVAVGDRLGVLISSLNLGRA
jgi:type III secretion system YscQ/HrcQ family protein